MLEGRDGDSTKRHFEIDKRKKKCSIERELSYAIKKKPSFYKKQRIITDPNHKIKLIHGKQMKT